MYLQEYFFFAYCYLIKERKTLINTEEGKTFFRLTQETRLSLKIRNFLFAERPRGNLDKIWHDRIHDNLHKKKLMKTDE